MKKRMIQQGDVLFFEVDKLPDNRQVKKFKHRVVFAEGEVTGHAHVTTLSSIETYTDVENRLWAQVKEPKKVVHEEHESVTLTPGIYRVGIVREIDPFSEEIREVAD